MISAAPPLLTQPFIAAVNHLLVREAWARERLGRFAGKSAKLAAPPFSMAFRVRDDGLLAPMPFPPLKPVPMGAGALASEPEGVPEPLPQVFDVTLSMPLDAVPKILQGGQAAVMKFVRIEGDADFAAAIGYLVENLRWEPEEDLARVIGDAPAHRIGGAVRAGAEQFKRAGQSLIGSMTEYLVDENRQLVHRSELTEVRSSLTETRDDLARLEKRLERLAGRVRPAPRQEPT